MDLEARIARLAPALHAEPGVAVAWLFGSAAKGKAHARSDLGLAVLWAGESGDPAGAAESEGALDLSAPSLESSVRSLDLSARLAVLLGRDVDVVAFEDADPVLKAQILRHGRRLVDRDPGRRKRAHAKALIEYWDTEWTRAFHGRALRLRLEGAVDGR